MAMISSGEMLEPEYPAAFSIESIASGSVVLDRKLSSPE
jgi:hypothetical protein